MKKHSIVAMLSILILVSAASVGILGSIVETPVEDEILQDNVDVPTWIVGTSWTYFHQLWQNDTDSDDYMYIEEELTYTVDAVEYIELEGEMYYGYNVTLAGEVIDGEGSFDGYSLDIDGGEVSGYTFCKMSDLGVVEQREYRYIYGMVDGFVGIDIWIYINQSYQPVIENYDFPVDVDDLFWGNTTMRYWGYFKYDAGMFGSDEDWFDGTTGIEGEVVIPYMETITVPAGNFETYYFNSTLNDGENGYIDRWYDPGIQSYVKEVAHTPEADWIKRLMDYNVIGTPNTLTIDPSVAEIYDEVTLSGAFPNNPDEAITLRIPEGATPVDEWSTTTDGSGEFSIIIEVPFAKDNTETLVDFASVGIVAEVDSAPAVEYAVSTLVILLDEQPVHLTTGWNFVSTNLDLWSNELGYILDEVDYGIPDNYTRLMYYDSSVEEWQSFLPGRAVHFNGLDTLDELMGFWIYVTDDVTLTFLGYSPGTTTITLQPGWNMVGLPSSTAGNHDLPVEIDKIGFFNTSAEYNLDYNYEPSSFVFEPGQGYLIHNPTDTALEWTVVY